MFTKTITSKFSRTAMFLLFVLTPLGLILAGDNIWTSIGPAGEVVNALAVDPNTPGTLYVGTETGVMKSTNGGGNWSAINTGLPDERSITQIVIDPVTPTTMFVTTSNDDVYKSTNSGSSWSLTGSLQYGIHDFVIAPSNPSTLYMIGNYDGVYRSTNGGASWAFAGLYQSNAYHLAVDPASATTLYAGGSGGIYRATNGGDNWVNWVSTSPLWYVYSLVIAPTNPPTIYAGTNEGLYRSTNGGGTWNLVNAAGTSVRVIAVDPVNPTTIYAGIYLNSVYKSTDSGINWVHVGGDELVYSSIVALAVDTAVPPTVYAGDMDGDGVFAIREVNNPVPVLTTISPSSAKNGDPAFTLTVTGSNFVDSSVVKWGAVELATTYVSATQLTATVPASSLTTPGKINVTVFNPSPGGGTSNALIFEIEYRYHVYTPLVVR